MKNILIAGATGVGKTTMAVQLAQQSPTLIISTSDVREVIRTVKDRCESETIHYSTYKLNTLSTPDSKKLLVLFRQQSEPILKAAAKVLNRHQFGNMICIVEGIHLLPSILPQLDLKPTVLLIRQPSEKEHWGRLMGRAKFDNSKPISKYKSYFHNIREIGFYVENQWLSINRQNIELIIIDNIEEELDMLIKQIPRIDSPWMA